MMRVTANRRGGGTLEAGDPSPDLEEKLTAVVAFAGGILFELDRKGAYVDVWTATPDLLAAPLDRLVGRTVADVLGPDHGRRFVDLVRQVLDEGVSSGFEYTLDVPAGRRTFSCMAYPKRSSDDETVLLLVRDTTDQKRLQAQLVQNERLAALGLVAASVGHEIRQPLAYAMSQLDVLTRKPEFDEARAGLETMRAALSRIADIAASLDLLACARRARTLLDVRRPLVAALDLAASAIEPGVTVERELADVPPVFANDGELCQVFLNLLLNAAQAVSGIEGAKIHVRSARAGDRVRVSIVDNGSGIAEENRARVFDPFFTTKAAGKGTGLGLFATREIVVAHGGSIELDCTSGTVMHVDLPTALRAPLGPKMEDASPTTGRSRILLVDDEPRFLESLKLALEDDHDVVALTRGAAALELLRGDRTRFDVIVCDLAMPDVDGVELFERSKELGLAPRFIAMSAGVYTARAAAFVKRGECAHIAKPFALEALEALVARTAAKVARLHS